MKKSFAVWLVVFSFFIAIPFVFAAESKQGGKSGEELFKENCAPCHPDGGNIVNPQFTLHKKDREAHGVKTATDIVKKMRNPGPGMTKFDSKSIPDKDAKKVADYILKTFK
jgi:cytochrome c6